MPTFKSRGRRNFARKQRRIRKYGKFSRPSGAYKSTTRRSNGRIATVYRPRFLNPFSRGYELVQLTYMQDITLNPTPTTIGAGGANKWAFSFNSLYDPDVTGTGHQPMFLDNYAQIYNKYKVSFAKITATVINHNVNTAVWNGSAVVSQPNYSYKLAILRDQDEPDTPSQLVSLIEQDSSNVRWRFVAPQLNGKLPKLSMKCAPHKQAGCSYDDDVMQADMAGQPNRNIKGIVCITSADGITDPPSVSINVKIRYYVKFFDRKMNQSEN